MNRDHLGRLLAARRESDLPLPDGVSADGLPDSLPDDMGSPESAITHVVDARDFVAAKRASMRCHPSQMAPDHFMLAMPEDAFAEAMGWEWFIGAAPGEALGGIIAPR